MASIKKYILEQVARRELTQEQAKAFLTELAAAGQPAAQPPRQEEIAIIGMAGRFPMAPNAEAFWELLRDGINCIRDFPEPRRQDFEPILRNPHYTEFLTGEAIAPEDIPHAHARAGYLDEIDKFDAAFFGIPPLEATFMDPYQRVMLEVAWEAMEDAGYGGQRLQGSPTGVFLGKEGTNYSLYRYCSVKDPMQLTGSWESIMASRISYLFNFRGPCMVIDTACSAGLVSIHLAAQSLLNGECQVAIAGGINLSITGEFASRFQGGMNMDAVESRTGVIRTFDARANGTVWGEGVAAVLLKPLSKALADRDPIHAVIKGSAINNDGASNGLTAPNAEAQEEVIVRAWEKARIQPESLSYIEAHGTGTVLGDPIEFKGLTGAFRRFTPKRQFCAIGSLKTNMGHLVAASGVASLFKIVKSLQHRQLAPTINFGQPNPYINFLASPLYVNDTLRPWTVDEGQSPRRAGVSSFGFSHTNCHMVLEEAPQRPALEARRPAYCLTLSGQTRQVLEDYLARFRDHCRGEDWQLADLCYTASTGRGHYGHRLAIVAGSEGQLREELELAARVIAGEAGCGPAESPAIHYGHHRLVSDRKKQREAGEITDSERKDLSRQAAQALERWLEANDPAALTALAGHYAAGAEIDWNRLYAGEPRYRLPLPTYPFQRVRVWADPKISRLATATGPLHPLVEQQVGDGAAGAVFETRLAADRHWVLTDHRIMNHCVVPGTTYLEMVRFAAARKLGSEALELREVFFLQPLVVADGQQRRVRLTLRPQGAGLAFQVESLGEGEQDWQSHVEGQVLPLTDAPGPDLDPAAFQSRAEEAVEDYQGESDTGVFQFGPHWDTVRAAWRAGDETLARLALPQDLAGELAVFQLHPSMLDNAVNLTSQAGGETFLPFTYRSLRIFGPFTQPMYSLIRYNQAKAGSGETRSYDITLADDQGRVIGEIRDYVAKRVHNLDLGAATGAGGAQPEALSLAWTQMETPAPAPAPEGPLVVVGQGAALDGLVAGFQARGVEVRPVVLESGDQALADLAGGDTLTGAAGLVFAADFGPVDKDYLADSQAFSARRRAGVDTLFKLVKALLEAKVRLPWGLGVLTSGAWGIDGGSAGRHPAGRHPAGRHPAGRHPAGRHPADHPLAAATATLGVVIGQEYGHLPCRLLDAWGADDEQAASTLLDIEPGRLLALRGDRLYGRRLVPVDLPAAEPLAVREDGAYLITGGLGGLGLAAAAHLADRGKANVVLLGRSPLPPRAEWQSLAQGEDATGRHPAARRCAALLELEPRLGSLEYRPVDMGDADRVREVVADIVARHGAVRGVFHLAGVAGDGFLMNKDFARFDAVLTPKLEGSRNLLAALAGQQPDFCLLYSSITALTGGEGQGDYAAANAFLDALSQGNRGLTAINWPSWKDAGMAVAFGVEDHQTPFAPLTAADAFHKLEAILAGGLNRVLPSRPNGALLAEIRHQLPFDLAPELKIGAGGSRQEGEAVQVQIRGKSGDDLTQTERVLAQVFGAVLGLEEVEVFTSFQDMGGNSLIATHLLKLIEEQFPGTVDISDLYSYPSIDELGSHIDSQRGEPEAPEAGWDDMVDRLLDGDDSIDSLLDRL